MPGPAAYALRRLAFSAVTVLVAVTANFVLFRALPGTAVSDLSQIPQAGPELQEALQKEFGLDRSLPDQYVIYLGRLAHGSLGISFDNQRPVTENLAEALRNTVPMVTLGTVLAMALGVAVGTVSAWRRGTWFDRVSSGVTVTLFSFPAQWIGLVLLILFAGALPSGGMRSPFLGDVGLWERTADQLRHMVLPAATLALAFYGNYALVVRSAVAETLAEDYVLTARAKGLGDWAVLRRHACATPCCPPSP